MAKLRRRCKVCGGDLRPNDAHRACDNCRRRRSRALRAGSVPETPPKVTIRINGALRRQLMGRLNLVMESKPHGWTDARWTELINGDGDFELDVSELYYWSSYTPSVWRLFRLPIPREYTEAGQ